MVAAGNLTYLESDGKAVNVTLSYDGIAKDDVVYAEGWLGIAAGAGDSGDEIALTIDRREYQFTVPAGLSVSKGDTVYITLASIGSGHVPADAAYSTSSGAGKVALFKATAAKDSNNMVTGILLPGAL
jgi:hypothetical protein